MHGAEVSKLADLVLSEPLNLSSASLHRPYDEVIGTGIGEFRYKNIEGYPIYSVFYYVVDASLGENEISRGKAAELYIAQVLKFKEQEGKEKNSPPVSSKIAGYDCLIYDFPPQDVEDGYLQQHYLIEFYIPEHERIYAIRFTALWSAQSEHPYQRKLAPALIKKATKDFINYNL